MGEKKRLVESALPDSPGVKGDGNHQIGTVFGVVFLPASGEPDSQVPGKVGTALVFEFLNRFKQRSPVESPGPSKIEWRELLLAAMAKVIGPGSKRLPAGGAERMTDGSKGSPAIPADGSAHLGFPDRSTERADRWEE